MRACALTHRSDLVRIGLEQVTVNTGEVIGLRPRHNGQTRRSRLEWVVSAMGYKATADKDGIGASRQRAELTRRVDHQHMVLDGERDADGGARVQFGARTVLKGAMAQHVTPTYRRHSQNIRHPAGVPWRKHHKHQQCIVFLYLKLLGGP